MKKGYHLVAITLLDSIFEIEDNSLTDFDFPYINMHKVFYQTTIIIKCLL